MLQKRTELKTRWIFPNSLSELVYCSERSRKPTILSVTRKPRIMYPFSAKWKKKINSIRQEFFDTVLNPLLRSLQKSLRRISQETCTFYGT